MTYDIKLTGFSAIPGYTSFDQKESVELLVSADEDLVASSILPRTSDYTYDGTVRGYDALDPEDGFAFDQDSWHRGAGLDVIKRRGEDDYRYATANGVITFAKGSFSSGYFEEDVEIPAGVVPVSDNEDNYEEKNVWGAEPIIYKDSVYCSYYKYLLRYENGVLSLAWECPYDTPINSLAVYQDKLFIGIDYVDVAGSGQDENGVDNPDTRVVYYLLVRNNEVDDVVAKTVIDNGDGFATTDPIVSKAAVIRNQNDTYSLAIVGPNGFLLTDDPDDTTWTERNLVGHSSNIRFNSLTAANETVYIGCSDGLFAYNSTNNTWVNIEPSLGLFAHVDRYSRVIARNGGLYVARYDHNLWRIDDGSGTTNYTELRSLLNFPAWIGMSGNVAAMTQDSNALYCMLSESPPETGRFPYALPLKFGEGYQSTYTLIAVTDNDTASHVMSMMSFENVGKMIRYAADSRSPTELLVFGTSLTANTNSEGTTTYTDPLTLKVVKMVIPPDEDIPYRSNFRIAGEGDELRVPCNPDGFLTTPWYDFHWPDTLKVLVGCSIGLHYGGAPEDTANVSKAVIEYRTETQGGHDSEGWTTLGETSNVGFSTIYTTRSHVLFHRIRFRIRLVTDKRVPMLVDSFVVHGMFGKPHRKRHQFLFNFTKSARDFQTTNSDANPIEKRQKLGRMVNDYPILLLEFNPKGNIRFLNDRDESEPRYVRIRRFDDDLQSRNRYDTRTSIEMIELRGNL